MLCHHAAGFYLHGLSVLMHIIVSAGVPVPSTVRPPEEVMEIDLSDIPRATDFLPAERGILENPPPGPAPAPPPPARKEAAAPRAMQGRVPDLPVKPDLPPEEASRSTRGKRNRPARRKGRKERKPAGARPGGADAFPRDAAERPRKKRRTGKRTVEVAAGPHAFLGRMVMAREEPSGGRGQGATAGNAVGTGGQVTGKEGVTEEGGGGSA